MNWRAWARQEHGTARMRTRHHWGDGPMARAAFRRTRREPPRHGAAARGRLARSLRPGWYEHYWVGGMEPGARSSTGRGEGSESPETGKQKACGGRPTRAAVRWVLARGRGVVVDCDGSCRRRTGPILRWALWRYGAAEQQKQSNKHSSAEFATTLAPHRLPNSEITRLKSRLLNARTSRAQLRVPVTPALEG